MHMENKVTLYNSNNIKIGETYMRRARQLVRQQRAIWTDSYETAIRFAPGADNANASTGGDVEENQLCFAKWWDGYYYPAVAGMASHDRMRVAFLDGSSGHARKEDIFDLQEAFKIMEFQGKWRNGWFFYKGTITSHNPMIMNYNDGDIEQIELRQLRGKPVCVYL